MRFQKTYCSQCGGEFGPGDNGYSHCEDHAETKLVLEKMKRRIDARLNDYLCEMKPDYDDSITGFNEAWDIVRKAFDEPIVLSPPAQKDRACNYPNCDCRVMGWPPKPLACPAQKDSET
jgi:hypothetical protein